MVARVRARLKKGEGDGRDPGCGRLSGRGDGRGLVARAMRAVLSEARVGRVFGSVVIHTGRGHQDHAGPTRLDVGRHRGLEGGDKDGQAKHKRERAPPES